MAVKNISTRMQICGRGAGCHGGHSAVDKAAYISRETMYCEYDGMTYYPKYSEDLVHNEVMLPENAPVEYKDPSVLWNSVEMTEKGNNAQLARTYRVELPNEWSYELATNVMRDYIKRNFVDKGMCVQFAIHDSENWKTGQRNLHCHMMMTLRSIDEQGQWMAKQKKVYLTDENGERIPVMDKKTGQQKVDKQNRKQWKCTTISTNDWSNRENAKIWRKNLTDTINYVNKKLGMTENFWEYRSFKDQGLDIIPQIHLGEKAAAMERIGIHTVRGDINRDIIARNAVISAARAAYEKAKEELAAVKAIPVTVVKTIKNEILNMIREVAKRNNDRLGLPIIKGKFIGKISNRSSLQDKQIMENYVHQMGWTTFDEMKEYKKSALKDYESLNTDRSTMNDRMDYLTKLIDAYNDYEPYIKYNKECWSLRGLKQRKYKREHMQDLSNYKVRREYLKNMIREEDKTITPKKWRAELKTLQAKYDKTEEPLANVIRHLAKIDVLSFNKGDLERMLENERHTAERQRNRTVDRNIGIE